MKNEKTEALGIIQRNVNELGAKADVLQNWSCEYSRFASIADELLELAASIRCQLKILAEPTNTKQEGDPK